MKGFILVLGIEILWKGSEQPAVFFGYWSWLKYYSRYLDILTVKFFNVSWICKNNMASLSFVFIFNKTSSEVHFGTFFEKNLY